MEKPRRGTAARRRVATVCQHIVPNSRRVQAGPAPSPEPTAATPALDRELESTYDYVVVGAGSAGCVVASRLSEDPDVSVLLVEAGGSNQKFAVRSPFVTCPGLQNSDLDWAYRTTPQATTDGRVSHWPRGKCLGGSSSINYMMYVRGDPRNYDDWARRYGCAGWSYEEVLPFFKKSENLLGADPSELSSHGVGGPLHVTKMAEHDFSTKSTCERWVQACEAAGLPQTQDYNGPCQRGASIPQHNVKGGVRCDTATAFLFGTGALTRPNLTVLTGAPAMRVALRDGGASGVYLQPTGRLSKKGPGPVLVGASREVVLCCGAVGTPQLLMLSGIGPEAHLREHGIDCVSDLPVGENLQDHLLWPLTYPTRPGVGTGLSPGRPLTGGVVSALAKHLLFGTGTFSFPWLQGTAFDHSRLPASEEAAGNDMQIHFLGFSGGGDEATMENNFGIAKRADRPLTDPSIAPLEGVTFLPTLLLPKSAGTVRLASADPEQHPVIEPQYFSDPHDLEVCVAATRHCRRIAAAPPLGDMLGDALEDSTIAHPADSDEYIREYVRRTCITVYHPVGTARMGDAHDARAVVDPRLRVRGVRGLRVADASVMPMIVSGNTNAPCIMIGERAAAFLWEERA